MAAGVWLSAVIKDQHILCWPATVYLCLWEIEHAANAAVLTVHNQ